MLFESKKWRRNGNAFPQKKTDLPIICLPWHFRGSGHTETYFWNKISGLPWNFQPPRCHSRWKNDKKRWKKRSAFLQKKTDLPIICLPWQIMAIWRFVLKLIRDFPITDIDKKLFVNWCQFWRREMAKRHCYIVLIFCSSGPSMKPCKKIWAVPQVNIVDFLLKECHNCDVFPAT